MKTRFSFYQKCKIYTEGWNPYDHMMINMLRMKWSWWWNSRSREWQWYPNGDTFPWWMNAERRRLSEKNCPTVTTKKTPYQSWIHLRPWAPALSASPSSKSSYSASPSPSLPNWLHISKEQKVTLSSSPSLQPMFDWEEGEFEWIIEKHGEDNVLRGPVGVVVEVLSRNSSLNQ